ncbi:unnamed protein product [Spirodela intermedia]|uniref:U5 small nuclear ribonucleoprotein TSSC4 n=1 Tax=Spirodela intermedia TaxID=51605 RepID=A0A7I8IQ38_SPIIN|nr:unnamed protein product [Spirodela intermedia]CAA6660050.1 unnamed protein product [Spirodela intermedia]
MEDSFKARVERLFGSHLFETVPRSSFPDTSWSVVEGEVEKKEWNRERGEARPGREETPLASTFDECFAKSSARSRKSKRRRFEDDIEDIEDAEDEEKAEAGEEDGDDVDREERDIRSSIGLDSTLDYEEEEDEFDRAAVGMADVNERVYMRDVKDHGPYINYHSIIEDTSEEVYFDKDPRADHSAANARLREDREAGVSIQVNSSSTDAAPRIKPSEGDVNLKPILKRKNEVVDLSEAKNVIQDVPLAPAETEATRAGESSRLPHGDPASIPDYVRNPSKYVCYSLESEENVNDESNRQAFDDFWKMVRGANSEHLQLGSTIEPPRSIIFTPRKRATVTENQEDKAEKESARVAVRRFSIASEEAPENEILSPEKDDMDITEERIAGSQKPGRQYRSRPHTDD